VKIGAENAENACRHVASAARRRLETCEAGARCLAADGYLEVWPDGGGIGPRPYLAREKKKKKKKKSC